MTIKKGRIGQYAMYVLSYTLGHQDRLFICVKIALINRRIKMINCTLPAAIVFLLLVVKLTLMIGG